MELGDADMRYNFKEREESKKAKLFEPKSLETFLISLLYNQVLLVDACSHTYVRVWTRGWGWGVGVGSYRVLLRGVIQGIILPGGPPIPPCENVCFLSSIGLFLLVISSFVALMMPTQHPQKHGHFEMLDRYNLFKK